MKINIKDLSADQVYSFVEEISEPKYRADQLLNWLYKKNAESFNEMTNISKALRNKLAEQVELSMFKNTESIRTSDDVIKYRFQLFDDKWIESVVIPEEKKATLCLSTQVGCKFDCIICRTGQMGFERNLTQGEIIEQIIVARRNQNEGPQITNLVFMGMGEPLDNFENLGKALSIIIDKKALDFSPRYITVSTVGFIPNLLSLGQSFPDVGLAISLNATDNKTRDKLIPINRKYPIEKIIEDLKKYPMKPRRVITIEYVLISDINDSLDDAYNLARLLRGIKCKINLIPYNEFDTSPYKSPAPQRLEEFRMTLIKAGYTCITRKSRGREINAACGCLAVK